MVETLPHRRACEDRPRLYYAWKASKWIILRIRAAGKLSLWLPQLVPWIMRLSGGPFLHLWWDCCGEGADDAWLAVHLKLYGELSSA